MCQHALRELQLLDCQLALLPVGPWLRGLTSLNMAAQLHSLPQLLPAVAAAATNLRALRLGVHVEAGPEAVPAVWEAVQVRACQLYGGVAHLHFLPSTPSFL